MRVAPKEKKGKHMKQITRHKMATIVTSACFAAAFGSYSGAAEARVVSITANVQGSPLTVSVNPERYAGAIDSITYRGVEYVDTHDHGRELQSAIQVDNLGECFNPNEAGARSDGAGDSTSSTMQLATSQANVLRTVTRPAFWLSPDQAYGHACSPVRTESAAQNHTVLSDYTIERTARFFGPAIPNLLMINVTFTIPESRKSASVEALTGYSPPQFTTFYSYDPAAHQLTPLTANAAGSHSTTPLIIATPDGRNAMGVISPDIGPGGRPGGYYAYFYFPSGGATAKWSCAFSEHTLLTAGSVLRYSCPIAIGTLDEVKAAMDRFDRIKGR
jgi:hypothetical protein